MTALYSVIENLKDIGFEEADSLPIMQFGEYMLVQKDLCIALENSYLIVNLLNMDFFSVYVVSLDNQVVSKTMFWSLEGLMEFIYWKVINGGFVNEEKEVTRVRNPNMCEDDNVFY